MANVRTRDFTVPVVAFLAYCSSEAWALLFGYGTLPSSGFLSRHVGIPVLSGPFLGAAIENWFDVRLSWHRKGRWYAEPIVRGIAYFLPPAAAYGGRIDRWQLRLSIAAFACIAIWLGLRTYLVVKHIRRGQIHRAGDDRTEE